MHTYTMMLSIQVTKINFKFHQYQVRAFSSKPNLMLSKITPLYSQGFIQKFWFGVEVGVAVSCTVSTPH